MMPFKNGTALPSLSQEALGMSRIPREIFKSRLSSYQILLLKLPAM
jgi:hypothetical protein